MNWGGERGGEEGDGQIEDRARARRLGGEIFRAAGPRARPRGRERSAPWRDCCRRRKDRPTCSLVSRDGTRRGRRAMDDCERSSASFACDAELSHKQGTDRVCGLHSPRGSRGGGRSLSARTRTRFKRDASIAPTHSRALVPRADPTRLARARATPASPPPARGSPRAPLSLFAPFPPCGRRPLARGARPITSWAPPR